MRCGRVEVRRRQGWRRPCLQHCPFVLARRIGPPIASRKTAPMHQKASAVQAAFGSCAVQAGGVAGESRCQTGGVLGVCCADANITVPHDKNPSIVPGLPFLQRASL